VEIACDRVEQAIELIKATVDIPDRVDSPAARYPADWRMLFDGWKAETHRSCFKFNGGHSGRVPT
jgi:hypothetical protein